jgi:hypothetical protein
MFGWKTDYLSAGRDFAWIGKKLSHGGVPHLVPVSDCSVVGGWSIALELFVVFGSQQFKKRLSDE